MYNDDATFIWIRRRVIESKVKSSQLVDSATNKNESNLIQWKAVLVRQQQQQQQQINDASKLLMLQGEGIEIEPEPVLELDKNYLLSSHKIQFAS